MLLNYLKIAFRNLARQKGYAFINIVGLAIGLAACLLILLYVFDELSYDRYHTNADSIYRVTHEEVDENGLPLLHRVMLDPPVAPLLVEEFPEIEAAARLTPVGPLFGYDGRYVQPENTFWADPGLFDILTIPFVAGSPQGALVDPFSLVLSETQARALFGSEDPIGKSVVVNGDDPFTVKGVFRDLPHNTHLKIDALGSLSSLESWYGPLGWDSPNYVTYIRVAEGVSSAELESKLRGFLGRHRPETANVRLHLQRLTDIHLRSHLVSEIGENGDIRYVYLLSAVALFILGIACINFVNLSTARSARRAREVGMRKVLGARRGELVGQFLGESTLLVVLGLVLAAILVEGALPAFNDFTGKSLSIGAFGAVNFVALLTGVALIVGAAAGGYPALYLSRFRPAGILRGGSSPGGSTFRSVLVVTQFVVAIVLLNATLVVYHQLKYVNEVKLGFDKEQVLIVPTIWDQKENFEPIRQQLLRNPDILDVAQSGIVPFRRLSYSAQYQISNPKTQVVENVELYPVTIDPHFFPTYDIPFAAGRNLTDDPAADASHGFIINETAAARLGWTDPREAVGAAVRIGDWMGEIVGVVEDFHLESLHQKIAPLIFYKIPRNFRVVSLKIRPGTDITALNGFLESKWHQYEPESPVAVTVSFLDERMRAVYEGERRLGKIFAVFTALSILITCLGLYGMAAFSVERRTKEIGVRKVLGATAGQVVLLFSRDFVKLVLIAAAIGTPVAFLLARKWLESFAYASKISWWLFLAAGSAALIVAALTIIYQSARAATSDPVKSLRYE